MISYRVRINYRRISLRHNLSRKCVISSCGVSSRTMFTSHPFQRHYQNCDSASTPQSGTSHKTCLVSVEIKCQLDATEVFICRSYCFPHINDDARSKSHQKCLGRFGGNGSIAWTSAVSHVERTSNAFKVTMKLQTFLFQMVVTSCISVHYL